MQGCVCSPVHFQLESREHLAAGVIPGAQQTSTVVAAPSAAFAIPGGAGGSEAQSLDGSVRSSGGDGAACSLSTCSLSTSTSPL